MRSSPSPIAEPPGLSHTPLTLVELLRCRARLHPERRVYVYLPDGEREGPELTFGELDRRARAIAALLQQDLRVGDRALLLYPPGLDFIAAFLGCQYAGVVPVPVYAPPRTRPERFLASMRGIAKDASPGIALTMQAMRPSLSAFTAASADFESLPLETTDDLPDSLDARWQDPGLDPSALALMQYTSGSTGTPRGVMVTHENLLHNQRMIQAAFGHTGDSTVASWLPVYHDMGLIGNLLQPLYLGSWCVLMSPVAFLQKPFRWLQAISRYGTRTNGAPNFAYDLCVERVTEEQRASIDLSRWTLAYSGAERVRPETLDRFSKAFASCGFEPTAFFPCYGLAEGTLIVSGGDEREAPVVLRSSAAALEAGRLEAAPAGEERVRALVGCGGTLLDQEIRIVDPEHLTALPEGRVGEIWVSGRNVAQGYWNDPATTRRAFQARLAGTGEGPFLRTGDLGALLRGELFITGRLKELIIVDGRNHFPQDIELTVENSHPALRSGCVAAFAVEIEGRDRLVVMAEVDERRRRRASDLDEAEVLRSVRRAVAEAHELSVFALTLVPINGVPKTTSGKIQRHRCRAAFLEGRDVLAQT